MKSLMKARSRSFLSHASLGLVILLSACSEKPAVVAAAAKVQAANQLTPQYESTLAEGIDFKKPGYPSFLIEVAGVSNRDEWGRWTDATASPAVRFRFSKPLPKKFTLELQANAFGPNEGKPTKIRVGNVEREVTIKNVPSYSVYAAEFDDVVSADTIEIIPPNPVLPREVDATNKDERKLGLGLVSLKIKTAN